MNFLDKELVLRIQFLLIEDSGGAHGLRDEGGLESALNAAQNRFYYEEADITICAATYAFHLCKRTLLLTAISALLLPYLKLF